MQRNPGNASGSSAVPGQSVLSYSPSGASPIHFTVAPGREYSGAGTAWRGKLIEAKTLSSWPAEGVKNDQSPVMVAPDGRTHSGLVVLHIPSSPSAPAAPGDPTGPAGPTGPTAPGSPFTP